jgi:hypothetical protein
MAKEAAHRGKKGKKHLRAITTHKADDGTFPHEHHYVDENGQAMPSSFGGVSTSLDDVQQHMADHFGGDQPQPEEADQGGAPTPDDGGQPAPAA